MPAPSRIDTAAQRRNRGLWPLAFSHPLYQLTLGRGAPRELARVPPDPWPGEAERGAQLVAGVYAFGGRRVESPTPPWAPSEGEDFAAELHGFDWLRDLRAVGSDAARRQARALVGSWIDSNTRWDRLIWRPDVLGQRVANWLATHDFFCASADDAFRGRVITALYKQFKHLSRAVEEAPPGVGQIAALKGLILGGLALPDGDTHVADGLKLLVPALAEQLGDDGGHVRRNPWAQVQALRHLVDLRAALGAARTAQPEALQQAIERLGPLVRLLRHGDGLLPLFQGGQEGERAVIETVLAQADPRTRPLKATRLNGYERVLAGRTLLLFDVAGPPPARLDHGAHAGLLAFELSVGRERMIVNCGAAGNAAGQVWREALRGTQAHSTVSLARSDSVGLASDGGVTRRPGAVEAARWEERDALFIEAAHDGYLEPLGMIHHRRLAIDPGGEQVDGLDRLVGPAGRAFAVRFHLHPSVVASAVDNGTAVLIKLPSGAGWRFRARARRIAVEDSIYCGRPGERRRSSQMVIAGVTQNGETQILWQLMRERRD